MRFIKELLRGLVQTIVGTFSVGLIFFAANDFLFKTPNLNGRWELIVKPDSAKSMKIEVMELTYTVLIHQEGEKIKGVGEKTRAFIPARNKNNVPPLDEKYAPGTKARVRIEIEGYIEKNYLSEDRLIIQYNEKGTDRLSSTVQTFTIHDDESMSGSFISTVSDSEGKVEWARN